ncbi:MAG: hypothetical protein J5J00_02030 [Deltaproteobacteria bacterium]|nr:hypothetical protein [Deltaproteobacteria bacterium]
MGIRIGVFILVVTTFALSLGTAAQEISPGKVWSVEEVLSERRPLKKKKKVRYCQGGRFEPCVCPSHVSRHAQYRPAVKECGDNAAIILSGRYLNVYSAVVRDNENRDRWPLSDFGNCSDYERDVLGLNKCSAFKVQERFGVEDDSSKGDAEVHCLGASGYSSLFNRVTRMTVKLADDPNSSNDPLVRWCLKSPKQPLN